jgi:hypothetical protein
VEAVSFFHTAGGVVSSDDVVLGCYELAKYYGIDPRVFLDQTISEVQRHRYWTFKLADKIRSAQEAEAPEQ